MKETVSGSQSSDAQRAGQLKVGSLSAMAIAFFVISAAGPLVAMSGGVPIAMLFGNGAGTPALFLLAVLILFGFSTGYTAMARHVRSTGAFYAFAHRGLGRVAAGATGAIALLSYNALQIGLYGLLGAAAHSLVLELTGQDIAWWIFALVSLLTVGIAGYRQIDLSAKVLGLLVAAEYLIVVLLDIFIFSTGGKEGINFKSFTSEYVLTGTPSIGIMLGMAAFVGFEATTIYSEEARNPEKSIPRATYFSLLLIGTFYVISSWALVLGVGVDGVQQLLQETDPSMILFALADQYIGGQASFIMMILFVTSCFASVLAFHNAIARYFYALGREGLLHSVLAQTHAKHLSPHCGSVLQTTIALVVLLVFVAFNVDPILVMFTFLSAIATLGIVVLLAVTAVAILAFFARHNDIKVSSVAKLLTLLSAIALIKIALFTTINFDVMSGVDQGLLRFLPLIVIVFGVVGAYLSRRIEKF